MKPSIALRAACAALACLPLTAVYAGAPIVKTQAPGYYRMMLGDFEVTALLDGTLVMPVGDYLNDVTPEQVKRAFAREYLSYPLELSVNAFLINTGSKLVLIDTGFGASPEGTGQLLGNLKAAGYAADQIDEIYITHMHADHAGGLSKDGVRQFPNATVRAGRKEGDYWLDPKRMAAAGPDAKESFERAMAMLDPYVKAGKYRPIDGDVELVSGIRAVATPGHTPGHTCYLVESRGNRLLLIGDMIHVGVLQFPDPSITLKFDSDSREARAQRLRIFGEAAQNGEWIGAAHLSFPGIGHVRAEGAGFTWIPVNYGMLH
jgi:glyoxylase-like metal-dependent hydrolase (beta-lactamase superfamily II)